MDNYITSQSESIFRSVAVLIYVFDVESRDLERDYVYFQTCLEALMRNSQDAKVFCLVHKMDLVQQEDADKVFHEKEAECRRLAEPMSVTCFATSIWDETLYKAWSAIVYQLIPNVQHIESSLSTFIDVIDADEVLLFEKATFLMISHCERRQHPDIHRFEKISNIIKQFKLSCSKVSSNFNSMEVRNSVFAAYIDGFTTNTYVMVIMSDPTIPSAATIMNIKNAKKTFEKLEKNNHAQHLVQES